MKGTMYLFTPEQETPSVTELDGPLKLGVLHDAVGGYIETVPYLTSYNGKKCVAFCNEEGKFEQLPFNKVVQDLWDIAWKKMFGDTAVNQDWLAGNVVILCGDDEFMEAL